VIKNKIKIFLALIFLSSCGDIELEFPQPTYLKNLDKIASNFHGSFERIGYVGTVSSRKQDTIQYNIFETYCLIDSDPLIVGSENLIIKHQGNKLFVNLKKDNYYALYVLSRFSFFGTDSLLINTIMIGDEKPHHYSDSTEDVFLDYMLLNKLPVFDEDISSSKMLIADSLSVNQLNTLLNWTSYTERLKFNK